MKGNKSSFQSVRSEKRSVAGLTTYGRIAHDLWLRIAKDEWRAGARLPTVAQLAKQYRVAAVTIRSALALLAKEGLIHSQQGRGTFLKQSAPGNVVNAFDPWVAGPEDSVRVLSRDRGAAVPATLADGAPVYDDYVHLRRLHFVGERPVSITDVYIASIAYDSIPLGLDETYKIGLLLINRTTPRAERGRQVVTVERATRPDCRALALEPDALIVLTERRFLDEKGLVLGASAHRYAPDRFRLAMDQPVSQILADMSAWQPLKRSLP